MVTYTFLAATLIIVLLPGTGSIYTISKGLLYGKKQSIYAALGCTLGMTPHLIVSILCLSIFGSVNQVFLNVVKIFGVLYLLYIGISMFKGQSFNLDNNANSKRSYLETCIHAGSVNILNPKLTIFYLAFLPQFVSNQHVSITTHAIVLGLISMIMTFFIFTIYGIIASTLYSYIQNNPKTLNITYKVFGLIFIYLALQLGFGSYLT